MNYGIAFCLIVAIIVIGASSERTERICEPGLIRHNICGPCKCNSDGTAEECDNSFCLQPGVLRPKRIARAAGDRCIPGQRFKLDCNSCVCPDSGIRSQAACTLMACPPSSSSGSNRRYNNRRYYPRW